MVQASRAKRNRTIALAITLLVTLAVVAAGMFLEAGQFFLTMLGILSILGGAGALYLLYSLIKAALDRKT